MSDNFYLYLFLLRRDKLIRDNIKLVSYVYKNKIKLQYFGYMDGGDLMQYGCIGLMRAAEYFDPTSNFTFSSYAVKIIQNEMTNAINNSLYAFGTRNRRKNKNNEEQILDALPFSYFTENDNEGEEFNVLEKTLSSDDSNKLDNTIDMYIKFKENLKDEKDKIILDCLEKGMNQASIAKIIGISQTRVSKRKIKLHRKFKEAIS